MISWDEYADSFYYASRENGYSEDYISSCLSYAKNLYEKSLPIIYNETHFSLLVGYKLYYIYAVSNKPQKFYTKFNIPKKNGGLREINAPYPSLQEIQRWLLDNILYKITISKFAKAYKIKSDIIDNARFHRRQPKILRLDIKDFFPSIKSDSIYYIFRRCGYSNKLSGLFTRLCTLDGCLPQGAPTSPAISNIFFKQIDNRIGGYAINNHIRYTRYADDMFFSGNFDTGKLLYIVKLILCDYNLKINEDKTHLMKHNSQQRVTGIITNSNINVARILKRKLLQIAFYINKYGLESHMIKCNIIEPNYIQKLLGEAYFIKHVNKYTPKIDWIISIFKQNIPKL